MIPDATTTSPAGHRTIGVAVPVPEPWGERLREHRASFGDPLAASIPTHVTLLPPTPVADELVDDVAQHLEQVASTMRPFDIHLRGTATFRPVSPVVFVQLVEGIGECELLERAVRRGPLERDLAFYYHPHVTVAHHLPDDALDTAFEALAGFECRFTVDAFHLYEHGDDGVWRTDRAFGFGARAESAAVDGVR
ncbi:2'-5' RNA ligase family protein [Angustibacter aerolatus]